MEKMAEWGRVLCSVDDGESRVVFFLGRKGEKYFMRSMGPRVFILKVSRASP